MTYVIVQHQRQIRNELKSTLVMNILFYYVSTAEFVPSNFFAFEQLCGDSGERKRKESRARSHYAQHTKCPHCASFRFFASALCYHSTNVCVLSIWICVFSFPRVCFAFTFPFKRVCCAVLCVKTSWPKTILFLLESS